jgi:hypothetical protein
MENNNDFDPISAVAYSPEAAVKLGSATNLAVLMVNLQTCIERVLSRAESVSEKRGNRIVSYKKISVNGDFNELTTTLRDLQNEQARWKRAPVQESSPDLLGMPTFNKV